MTPLNVSALLRRGVRRYQRALLRKAVLTTALSAGVVVTLAWRLSQLSVHRAISLPTLLVGPLVIVTGAAAWLRWRWISSRQAAAHLDRTLHLEQRLITAEEVAQVDPPPALLPRLVQEVEGIVSTDRLRGPRLITRPTLALALAWLLLLAWPWLGRLPGLPGFSQRPDERHRAATGEEPSSSPQRQEGGGQTGAGGEEQDGSQVASLPRPSTGQGLPKGAQGGQSAPSGQPSPGQPQQQEAASSPQSSDESARQGNAGARSDQNRAGDRDGGDQGRGNQDQAQSSGASAQQAHDGASGSSGRQPSGQPRGAGQQTLGNQPGMQAEIQELLKEMSQELKRLEAQVAALPERPPQPTAGTTTDPELYGASELSNPQATRPVPLQLKTDGELTPSKRPGGGAGAPSGEVDDAAPQLEESEVELSPRVGGDPSAEPPSQRVPPSYREIFERLRRDTPPSNETTP